MQRFVTFVDGSNLDGVLKHLNLRVDDYGSFYRYIFEQSVSHWGRTFAEGAPWESAQHARIYWYVVGKMDEWDLNDPKAESRLRNRFELNPRLRDSYIEDVLRKGQNILVQVSKESLGTKGARITSFISLPGRYLVYMPQVSHLGVSRRIRDAAGHYQYQHRIEVHRL